MKRKGFISIIVIFAMIVIMISVIYLNYLTSLQYMMELASKDKIQSRYNSENKINKVFYDSKYYDNKLKPAIMDHLRYPTSATYQNAVINIDNSDKDSNDSINLVNATFYNNGTREYFELTTESKYNGITNKIKASGPIVNDIFEIGGLPLLSYDLDFNTCAKVSNFYDAIEDNLNLDSIPTNIKGLYTFDYDKIKVKTNNSTLNNLIKFRNETQAIEAFGKEVFFIIKNNIYTPIELVIEDGNNGRVQDLYGIIYLEGDLVISSSFTFSGILILKGGDIIVNTTIKPKFTGIIITDGETDYIDDIELKHNRWYIYKYGIYLPGFLDPRIEISK